MAIKEKRIKCLDCGERVSVMRGERGPASKRCDICREEHDREKNREYVQAVRDRQRLYRSFRLA